MNEFAALDGVEGRMPPVYAFDRASISGRQHRLGVPIEKPVLSSRSQKGDVAMTPEQLALRERVEAAFVVPDADREWLDKFLSDLDALDGGEPRDLTDEEVLRILDRLDPPKSEIPPYAWVLELELEKLYRQAKLARVLGWLSTILAVLLLLRFLGSS